MNISKNIKIILSEEEQKAVEKVNAVVAEFANKNLCDKMSCCSCPLDIFCRYTGSTNNFEETLNDIANMG